MISDSFKYLFHQQVLEMEPFPVDMETNPMVLDHGHCYWGSLCRKCVDSVFDMFWSEVMELQPEDMQPNQTVQF